MANKLFMLPEKENVEQLFETNLLQWSRIELKVPGHKKLQLGNSELS